MEAGEYERFTHHLVEWAEADPRVTGVVALGSMANPARRDEWSDHDFWVVTTAGQAEKLRNDPSWLPDSGRIVVYSRETVHGRSAIYDDGHLIELAVFEDEELDIARANDFEVLVDHGSLRDRMHSMAASTAEEQGARDPDGDERFGNFVAQLVIGLSRCGRGEELSANHLIRGWAVRSLLDAIALVEPTGRPGVLDNLDPHRRFELAHPELGHLIADALGRPIPECAEALIAIAEKRLVGRIPSATPTAMAAVRALLGRVQAAVR